MVCNLVFESLSHRNIFDISCKAPGVGLIKGPVSPSV